MRNKNIIACKIGNLNGLSKDLSVKEQAQERHLVVYDANMSFYSFFFISAFTSSEL